LNLYSNGKLLLTGEYLVLDGAKALALPTTFGQRLQLSVIEEGSNSILQWLSYDDKNTLWFQCEFKLPSLEICNFESTNKETLDIAKTLQNILFESRKLNPNFLKQQPSIQVKTFVDFPKNWGLGSSSTLINNIANWAKIDAFQLQFNTFGGSAYDIASAQNDSSIIYQLKNKVPIIDKVNFNPSFKDDLFFVHLNKKQNSRQSIKKYNHIKKNNAKNVVEDISSITKDILMVNSLSEFDYLISKHENIISKIIHQPNIKDLLFKDYSGQVKSLGAWGGDFILATGHKDQISYFNKKGFNTIIPYKTIIL
jgi:mevalonate kinase